MRVGNSKRTSKGVGGASWQPGKGLRWGGRCELAAEKRLAARWAARVARRISASGSVSDAIRQPPNGLQAAGYLVSPIAKRVLGKQTGTRRGSEDTYSAASKRGPASTERSRQRHQRYLSAANDPSVQDKRRATLGSRIRPFASPERALQFFSYSASVPDVPQPAPQVAAEPLEGLPVLHRGNIEGCHASAPPPKRI